MLHSVSGWGDADWVPLTRKLARVRGGVDMVGKYLSVGFLFTLRIELAVEVSVEGDVVGDEKLKGGRRSGFMDESGSESVCGESSVEG